MDTEDAIYTQALSALARGEQDTALPLLQQAAEAGIGEAAWLLAGRLEEQGLTQESITWYRRAAADGDPRAAGRILHPLARRAQIDGYQPGGVAEHPVPPRPRGLLGSGWMTRIVIPAMAAVAVVAVVAVIAVVGTVFSQRGTSPEQLAGSHPGTSLAADSEAAVRNRAVTWVMDQVSRTAVVGCDAQVCADLANRGFPGANLLTISPQAKDPLGADLVVSTADVRAQFRDRLATVWAPAIIAAFGSGNAMIEIRLEFPGGVASYNAAQGKYARARKLSDAQLLTQRSIILSAGARAQLRSGNIDPRLPELIAIMVHIHPLHIVDFGDRSPGGGPASLARSMDLATADPPGHLTPSEYINWMRSFIRAQRPLYRPGLSLVTLPGGQTALRVGYGAPSPLNP